MPSALVTGGAGFIGSHLVEGLLAAGWLVTVVDDLSSGDLGNIPKLGRWSPFFHQCDFTSKMILDDVKDGRFDVIFHLAARPRVSFSVENPADTNMTNVQKTVQLLEASRRSVKRFIFSSSSSVYGGASVLPTPVSYPKDPKSPYALQKSVVEDYCSLFSQLYGMDTVSLRYFNVFGPRAKGDGPYATAVSAWLSAIKNGKPLRSDGDGSQTRDMCYVSNVVQANMLAATSTETFSGQRFNVACGDSVSNREVLDNLKGRFGGVVITDAPWRPGDVMHTQADISETERVLGYKPRVKFWDGLQMTIDKEGL